MEKKVLKRHWDFPEMPVTVKRPVPATESRRGTSTSANQTDRGTQNPGTGDRIARNVARLDPRGIDPPVTAQSPLHPQLPSYWDNEYLRKMAQRNPWLIRESAQRSKEWKGFSLLDETVRDTPEFRAHLDAMEFWGRNAHFTTMLSLGLFAPSVAVEMLPVLAKPLALLGSFSGGVTAGELLQGTSITGKPLSTREKAERAVELALFAIAFFAANAEAVPGAKGDLKILPSPNQPYTESELYAARYTSELGFDVTLRPPGKTRGKDTSDLLVAEEHPFISREIQTEIYTPKSGAKPKGVISGAAKKGKQAETVIIDLRQTNVTTEQLGDAVARVRGTGSRIKRVIIISGSAE